MNALEGVRVLDISTVIAGPFAANIFSDFGADVIKVEMPGKGDSFRVLGPLKDGKSIRWASLNRNKRCITLDLHYDEGKEIFLELVSKSDVIIENFRTGTLDKWGLGIDVLRKANPKIIVTRITGYGQTGPRRMMSGFGQPCTAFAGVTYTMGFSDRHPISPPYSLADYNAGLNAVVGTIIALYNRDVLGGKAQEIDVSLYESLFRQQEAIVADYHINGRIKERAPKITGAAGPSGTFQTKDGKWVVMVTSNDNVFVYLCKAMNREDLLEKYAKTVDRFAVTDMLNDIVEKWVNSLTFAQLDEVCAREKYPLSLIYSIEDIFNDPHYAARNSIVEIEDPHFKTSKMPSVTPLLSETPGEIHWVGPDIGAHNDEIYKGFLGLKDEKIAELKNKGII